MDKKDWPKESGYYWYKATEKEVDKWVVDTVSVVYVSLLNSPSHRPAIYFAGRRKCRFLYKLKGEFRTTALIPPD